MSKVKKACILCNNESNLVKTECCSVWLCTGRDDNLLNPTGGPNSNNCNANHNQFTLCAIHYKQKHTEKDWRNCEKCNDGFQVQIYAWLGTNHYNHVKLEESAKVGPTSCKCCKKVINLDADGFFQKSDGSIHCKKCENIMITETNTPKPSPAKSVTQSPKKPKSPISKPVILTPSKSDNKPKKHKYKGLTSLQIIEALKNDITHKFGKASTSTSRSAVVPIVAETQRPKRPKSLDVSSLDKKTKRKTRARSMSKDSTKKEENAQPTERLSFVSLPCGERKPSNLRPYSMYQRSSGKKKLKSPIVKSNKRVSFNLIPQPPWQPSFSQPAVLPSMSASGIKNGNPVVAKDLKRKPDRSPVVVEKGRSPSPTTDQKRKRVKKNEQVLTPNSNDQKITIVLNKKKTPTPSPNKSSPNSSKKKVQGTTKKMNVEENNKPPVILA